MCKDHTLTRSANLINRNHPAGSNCLELCLWTVDSFRNITKMAISFTPELQTIFGAYVI